MASHFQAIGVETESSAADLIALAAAEGKPRSRSDGGSTMVWRDASGASVVVHLDEAGTLVCGAPSFAATSRLDVSGGEIALDPECRFCSAVVIEVVEGGEMVYPLAAQLENIDQILERGPSVSAGVLALSAFAEEVAVWPDERAYDEAEESPTFAARSLIPSGLFLDERASGRRLRLRLRRRPAPLPQPYALITGVVEAAENRRNEATGGSFIHASLLTLGGSVDVLLSHSDLPSDLVPGSVVQGSFWLIGQLSS